MKLKPLILFLFACSSLAAQSTFNWGDKDFKGNEKKRIYVEYQFDKKTIRDIIHSSLDTLVAFLKKNDYLKVEIDYYGYVNPRSSSGIVQGRANSVADYLMVKGIDTARIIAKGWNAALQKDTTIRTKRYTDVRIKSTCYKHETFNWNDTVFYIGSKREVKIFYSLDYPGPLPQSYPIMDSIVTFMKAHPSFKIEMGSHTDPRGSAPHNRVLSQARAQSIVDYMLYKGVDSARMIPKGYAFTQPISGCNEHEIALMKTQQEKETAWQKDRRTEVVIVDK